MEPRPGRARLHNHVEQSESLQHLDEPALVTVRMLQRLLHDGSVVAHDRTHDIGCVSVDSCDVHIGLLVVGRRR